MSNRVLEGWRTVELADIAKLSMGETLLSKNLTGEGIPVFSANTDDRPWGFTSNNRRRLQRGDIVVGARGSIGFPRRPDFDAFTCTQTTIAVQPDGDVVDSEYLLYALCATDILGIASQQAVPMLTIGSLSPLEVFLPSLDEQRRIAEVLRSVDEAISTQADVCSHLRDATDSLVDELFAAEIVSDAASLRPYGDACETVQVGIVVKPASYYVEEGGVPALRSTNIRRNEIDFSALVQLSQDGHAINRKSALRAGDVVTIRTGEPGKTAVIPPDAPAALNCIDIIFSRPKPSLRSLFAAYFINSSTARRQIAAMQGGLAQQHFNVGEMKRLKLPVPDLRRQDRLIEIMDAAWASIRAEESQLSALQATKRALLGDLLSGSKRVTA